MQMSDPTATSRCPTARRKCGWGWRSGEDIYPGHLRNEMIELVPNASSVHILSVATIFFGVVDFKNETTRVFKECYKRVGIGQSDVSTSAQALYSIKKIIPSKSELSSGFCKLGHMPMDSRDICPSNANNDCFICTTVTPGLFYILRN
jgi:hypothetical protein